MFVLKLRAVKVFDLIIVRCLIEVESCKVSYGEL